MAFSKTGTSMKELKETPGAEAANHSPAFLKLATKAATKVAAAKKPKLKK